MITKPSTSISNKVKVNYRLSDKFRHNVTQIKMGFRETSFKRDSNFQNQAIPVQTKSKSNVPIISNAFIIKSDEFSNNHFNFKMSLNNYEIKHFNFQQIQSQIPTLR